MDASYWITGMIAMQDNSPQTTTQKHSIFFTITNKYTKSSLDYCVRRRRIHANCIRLGYFEISPEKDCNLATPLGFFQGHISAGKLVRTTGLVSEIKIESNFSKELHVAKRLP